MVGEVPCDVDWHATFMTNIALHAQYRLKVSGGATGLLTVDVQVPLNKIRLIARKIESCRSTRR